MLIAALLSLLVLFGGHGGPFGELMTTYAKDPIKTTIVDKDRRASALKGLSILKDDIAELNKQVSNDLNNSTNSSRTMIPNPKRSTRYFHQRWQNERRKQKKSGRTATPC